MILNILIVFIVSLVQFSDSWIFNEINYSNMVRRGLIKRDQENELNPEDLERLRFNLIFPGTKWCGAGNIAENYEDLGPATETDKCCRAHDVCSDVIEAGETKHNLTNQAFYTRLSCKCDETFRQCLSNDGSETSTTIGLMYFNLIGTQCFRKDYNATGCKEYSGWLNTKCVKYEYDMTSMKFYQWFDVPNYSERSVNTIPAF